MPLFIAPVSHVDHLPRPVIDAVCERFGDRSAFFIESFELPDGVEPMPCGLHGPAMGDAPVPDDECETAARSGRAWSSRLCSRPMRPSRVVTVIAGPHEGRMTLYTAYAGPSAPREPGDPSLPSDDARAESAAFWAAHALTG